MVLKTSSSENRKQPRMLRSSVLVARGATVARSSSMRAEPVELLVLILREVIGLGVVAQGEFARGQRLGAGQQLDQRRFAGAVDAHQRHAVAALDDEIDAGKDLVIAVALGDVLEFGHDAPARLRLRKAEVDGLLFRRNFDALDALQFLDAALHLLRLRGLGAEADDEGFQLLDAILLVGVGRLQLRAALRLLHFVFASSRRYRSEAACSTARRSCAP